MTTTEAWTVEVFYDGDCPLCRREIALLRRWDRHSRIRFTNIASNDFQPADLGIEYDRLMAEIHGRLPDGTWIRGVEVFRRLYAAVGFGWMVAITRWPGLRQFFDVGYRWFARNRLRWTGRCTTACQIPAAAAGAGSTSHDDTHPISMLGQWVLLGSLVGVVCGSASAIFLWLLDLVTTFRTGHEAIVYSLPLAGLIIGWIYERLGKPIKAGNNLIIDTIHDNGPEIPLRMAPLVLLGTVLTHLFGGSAGREGTAVQMGASLTDWLSHRLRVSRGVRRQMLAAGVAGGFGSVFGTPIAGAVFGLEFVVLGKLEYRAIVPALIAAIVGDQTTRAWGIGHSHYPSPAALPLTPLLFAKWLAFAVAVAIVTTVFIELTHGLKRYGERFVPRLPLRMFLGGLVVIGLWKLAGTSDYLGLGVPTIERTFTDPELASTAFAWKLLFTAVTIGAGFLGGEVTPLFFIGAALGGVLARWLGIPLEMGAGVGLAAVFAAAANTPLALSIMAVELLGANLLPHVVLVSVVAYLLTGNRSIYPSQRLRKWGRDQASRKPEHAARPITS